MSFILIEPRAGPGLGGPQVPGLTRFPLMARKLL